MPVVTFKAWPQPELWNHTFQVTRMLGLIDFGGADFTEIYQAIHRIDPGDDESWHKEWFRLGLLAEDQAHEAERAGNPLSIRYAYQRASNYYRASQFYMPGSDNRKIPTLQRTRDCFEKAIPYQDVRVDSIEVPYEGTTLPGYFVHARWANGPTPTILYLNGADSLSEEAYFTVGLPAAAAGYNCLLFNAPGVGLTLYEKGLTTRVDCEHFVTRAVDYLVTRPEVDQNRICLAGESFAAYLVPRAAAFEKRIAAAVSWGATYDWGDLWRHETRPMFVSPHLITLFGAKDADDYLQKRAQYHLRGVLRKVTCPFLVLVGAEDWIPRPATQGLRYLEELGSTVKALKVIESDLGGVTHCQKDNLHVLHAETFNWLNTVLNYRPGPG